MSNVCSSLRPARAIARLVFPLLLAWVFALWPLGLYAANITVDGTTCTLPDAIAAANVDGAVGGCTAGSGADLLLLTAPTYSLTSGPYSDAIDPTNFSATPIITTTIIISGGVGGGIGGGATIERNSNDKFRLFTNYGNLTLQNVTVRNGFVDGYGGAIFSIGLLTVEDSAIVGSTAGFGGGGIDAYILTLINSKVYANKGLWGGGIRVYTLTLSDSQVFSNTADVDGGGLHIQDVSTLTRAEVFSNTAVSFGGGIYNSNIIGLTINDSIVSGNETTDFFSYGGGIYNTDGKLTLNDSTVSGNRSYFGSGIANHREGILTLNNSTVSGNQAIEEGGGIYNYDASQLVINDSEILHNTAAGGGGIANRDASTIVITDTTIFSNSALFVGGGLVNFNQSSVKLSGVTILANVAPLFGGGVAQMSASSTIDIDASAILSNTGGLGGGVSNVNGTLVLTNNEIRANVAITDGGALMQSGGNSTLSQNCIVQNSHTAVEKSGGALINADNNWWGASDGPSGAGPGAGDSVSADVLFTPILSAPVFGCPTRAADITFSMKSTPAGDLQPGQPLTYTLVVTNKGLETLTKIDLNDSLPDGFVLTQVISTGATIAPTTEGFRIAQLTPNQVATLHYVGNVDATLNSNQTLNASVDLIHPLDNESASSSNQVVVPVLSWSETGYVAEEENGVFTATLNLTPANPYASVTVQVAITDGAAVASAAVVQEVTFPPNSSSQPVVVTMAKDGVITPRTILLGLQAAAGAALGGANGGKATITLTEGDFVAGLAVSKSANVSQAGAGDTITFTYRITNTGNVTLTIISAEDDALGPVDGLEGELVPNVTRSATIPYVVQLADVPRILSDEVTVVGTDIFGAEVRDVASVNVQLLNQIYMPQLEKFRFELPGS